MRNQKPSPRAPWTAPKLTRIAASLAEAGSGSIADVGIGNRS